MSNTGLAIVVVLLALCVALALTNPSAQDYGEFLQDQLDAAVERLDLSLTDQERTLVRSLYVSQGPKLVERVLRQHTHRRNYGLFSLFESSLLDQRVIVLGVASRFFPMEGVEEAQAKLGQMVPAGRK